jgi:SPOR domain
MADNTFRTPRRGPAAQAGQQVDDPLAELARLIGRTEPRDRAARPHEAPLDAPEPTTAWPADARYAEPQPAPQQAPYVEPQPRYAEPQVRYDQPLDQPSDQYGAQYEGQYDDRQYDDRQAPPQPADTYPPYRPAPPSYNADYEQPDPYAAQPQRYDAQAHNPQAHDAQAYDDQPGYQDHPRYDDAHDPIQDLPAFLPRARDNRRDGRRDDDRYDDYAEEGQGDDDRAYELEDYEDDEEPPRKRRGFAIFAALLGLMVLGTAGAFGYRAMFGGSMLPGLPPIIKADDTPNKIVPAGSGANAASQASANDSGAPDKLVSREERPVDVPVPANTPRVVSTIPVFPDPNAGLQASVAGQPQPGQSMPGSIAPGPGGPGSGMPMQLGPSGAAPVYGSAAAPPMQQGPADQSAPVAGTSGSKKIRTVAIHAGQPDGADTAAPAAAPAASAHAPAARPAAAKPAASAPQGQGGTGPLSIVPSQGGQGTADAAHTRTALAHPAAAAPEPAPAAAGGGYSVQVSSQRSEAEAQAAYKGLQAKYPAQLGSRTATVRQVDLGDKGIYFRTLVGPYGSAEEAAQMCSSLKAAGGSCLVQRN